MLTFVRTLQTRFRKYWLHPAFAYTRNISLILKARLHFPGSISSLDQRSLSPALCSNHGTYVSLVNTAPFYWKPRTAVSEMSFNPVVGQNIKCMLSWYRIPLVDSVENPKLWKVSFLKHKLSRRTLVHICHRQTHRSTCMSRIVYIIHTAVCLYIYLYQSVCVYLFVCLACLFLYVYVSGSLCLSLCVFVCLRQSVRVSAWLPACLPVCLWSVCVFLFRCLSACFCVCLCQSLCLCLSTCPPACLLVSAAVSLCVFLCVCLTCKNENKRSNEILNVFCVVRLE